MAVAVLRPSSRNNATQRSALIGNSSGSRPRSECRSRRPDIAAPSALPSLRAPDKPGLRPAPKALPDVHASRQPSHALPSRSTIGGSNAHSSVAASSLLATHQRGAPSSGAGAAVPAARLPSSSRARGGGFEVGQSSVAAEPSARPLAGGSKPRSGRSMSITSTAGKIVASSNLGGLSDPPGSPGLPDDDNLTRSSSNKSELREHQSEQSGSVLPETAPALPSRAARAAAAAAAAAEASGKLDSIDKTDLSSKDTLSKSDSTTRTSKQKAQEESKRRKAPAGVVEDFDAGNWLSDSSISWAASSLAESGGSSSSSRSSPGNAFPKTVEIMDPAMAFWLAMQDDPKDLEEAKKSMKLQDVELMLCPINDSRDVSSADTGLHWTLLVCWCPRGSRSGAGAAGASCPWRRFRHYDSLGKGTFDPGFRQATKVASRLAGKPVEVEMGKCPRQANFYDCGVYVLLFAEIIAQTFLQGGTSDDSDLPSWDARLNCVTPMDVSSCRKHYRLLATASRKEEYTLR